MKSYNCAPFFVSTGPALVWLLLVVQFAAGEIIPAGRSIDWSQAGIPGGIPTRTTIYTTLTGINNTGASDVTSAIQSAINSCPSNQVVFLPAGTYRINGLLYMKSGVTLRGAGTNTILKSYASTSSGLINFGKYTTSWSLSSISTPITSGANAGSTSITVSSASGITAGSLLMITELNDSSFVDPYGTANGGYANNVDGWDTVNTRSRGQIVFVTSVSGTTIGFKPGLYSAHSRTPWASRMPTECQWAGVEDLKVYANNTGCGNNFYFQQAAYCWIKNVESDFTDGDHVRIDRSIGCEIRGSYFHDSFVHSAGTYDNQIGCWHKSSANLIVDNIVRRLHVGIMVENGSAGNVVAYNYVEGGYDTSVASGARALFGGINGNHGAHPQFNLFEGNVTPNFAADSYWGSSSDATLFRNYAVGTGVVSPPFNTRGAEDRNTVYNLIQGNYAIDIWESQRRYNIVGNIVGSAATKARGVVRKVTSPAGRAYDNPPYCFTYGYASGAGLAGTKENPTVTLLEHGNWDIAGGSTVWSSSIADRELPSSMFLSSKPEWFGALSWPPFDPANGSAIANNSMAHTNIPAGYRYVYGRNPSSSAPTTNKPPVVGADASPKSGVAPLSVAFSSAGSSDPEGSTLTYNWVFGDGTTSTAANPTKVYSTAGTYQARLTVSDGTSSTTSTNLTITVTAPVNQPPVVAANASPKSGVSPLSVAFSSAGSSDPEGATLTYNWVFGDGTTSTAANPTKTYTNAGTYAARLTVSDGTSSTTSTNLTITVTAPVNQPPVVAANASPKSGAAPLSVAFSSAGSSDPEGSTLTYNWVFGDGATSTAANPTKVYSTVGTYQARLMVSDGVNSTTSSNIAITVSAVPVNQPPVSVAGASNTNGVVPLNVSFSSAGSSDPEGVTLTYLWNFGDGTTSTAANPTKVYSVAGDYVARLTVSDGTNAVQSGPLAITALAPGSGLVAAYGFEDPLIGGSVLDTSGNSNNGIAEGANWVVAGKFGKALSFNGSNALVTIADSASLRLTSGMTLQAWVYPAATASAWKPVIFKPYDASQISYVLQGFTPSGVPSVYVSPSADNLLGTSVLVPNTWTHLAATYDGSTMRFYVNGVQVSSKAQTGAIVESSEALTIGGNALYGAYWNGLVDEVRVYNRAITPAEIQNDMNTPVVQIPPSPIPRTVIQ